MHIGEADISLHTLQFLAWNARNSVPVRRRRHIIIAHLSIIYISGSLIPMRNLQSQAVSIHYSIETLDRLHKIPLWFESSLPMECYVAQCWLTDKSSS